jgi:hypothetical protein
LSTIFVDFIFVDFDKILDKFIYLFGIFWGDYFMPTLPSWYGNLAVQRAWSEIMNLLANPKRKCWALESGYLEA